jgi:LmbE family N-acetylglucosaminyl deacetylase
MTDAQTSHNSDTQPTPNTSTPTDVASPFQFTRLLDGEKLRTNDIGELLGAKQIADECWMFVAPHDDDLCLGAGLLMQAGVKAGVDVRAVIVTDGSLGYCRPEDESDIVDIRYRETVNSFRALGIGEEQIQFLGFPDGGLTPYIGRKKYQGAGPEVNGYTGLQNSLTSVLRTHRPARVFVPSPADLHPDHRITHSELMISLFHATGAIWPELGAALLDVPCVYELAVYCDFLQPPNLELISSEDVFKVKLDSVQAFQSQVQIAALVESVRKSGPYEYIREVGFPLYSAETYKPMFR